MEKEAYSLQQEDSLVFTFVSEGLRGQIKKIVRYDWSMDNIYNLAFGDAIDDDFDLDDFANSNNGDIVKVMATVIQTIPLFFEYHPNKVIQFLGSTPKRMRVYGWIVEREKPNWENSYLVQGGFNDGKIEPFETGVAYDYFLITKT